MTQTTQLATTQPATLQPGEQALLLDGTLMVAVSVVVTRDPINSCITAMATVRALNADGTPQLDAHGQPIVSRHPRACDAGSFPTMDSQDQLSQDALKLALGDTSDATLGVADDNIRAAVGAAGVTGTHPTPSSLLQIS